jgi:hypothetical protein
VLLLSTIPSQRFLKAGPSIKRGENWSLTNKKGWGNLLRIVIMVTDNEESVKNAIKEILKSKNKGHEYALDLTRIKDKERKKEIMKRLTRF